MWQSRLPQTPAPIPATTDELVRRVIGCAVAVHSELGPGFLESVYRRAMCFELADNGIEFETERPIVVGYRGRSIPGQRLDLVVGGVVIVELKAVSALDRVHVAQLVSYLRTTGLRVGLLLNFHERLMKQGIRRVVL